MSFLFRLVLLALAAVGAIMIFRWLFGGTRVPDVKCATCSHCRRLFRDGVMCGFQEKEVFKNPAQINMCPDHEPRYQLLAPGGYRLRYYSNGKTSAQRSVHDHGRRDDHG